MARPAFRMVWRAGDTEAALHRRWRDEQHLGRRTRLHAMWLLHRNWRPEAVADALDLGVRTVHRWCDWYRQGGLDLVLARCQGNTANHSPLTPAQQARLRGEIASGRFRTGEEIRSWIKQEFDVEYRPNSIYTLTKRLKSTPKVPRPHHEHAEDAAQAAWKKGGCAPS